MENEKYKKEQDLWESNLPSFDKINLDHCNEEERKNIIGIDLGSKYTFVTAVRDGKFIDVKEDGNVIPSVFIITKMGDCLFGKSAILYAKAHDQKLLSIIKCCGYQKSASRYGFTYDGQYICTEFFRYLKELAENELKEKLDGAILTLSNMDMVYRWRIAHAAGKAGIKVYKTVSKSLAGAIETLVRDRCKEEIVLSCTIDGSYISAVCVENGDGIIEVLSQTEMDASKCKEDLHNKIVEVISSLVKTSYVEAEKIDKVMLFCNEALPKDKIMYMAFQGMKKGIILDKLYDQPVRGAAIMGGKLCGDNKFLEMLVLEVCSHPIHIAICKENAATPQVKTLIGLDVSIPTKNSKEIDVNKNESISLYVLYGKDKNVRRMKPLSKIYLDKMWTGDASQLVISLSVEINGNMTLEIENPSNNLRTRKQVYGCEYEQKQNAETMTAKEVIEKVLPVVDGIEWGIRNLSEEEKETPTAKGLIQVYKKWCEVMKELHITKIPAEGKSFDARYHNAIIHVVDLDMEENIIVEELQTGYMYNGQVLRPSLVKVAN